MARRRKLIEVEIYLPTTYNDGQPVEKEKFDLTYQEFIERFEAYSLKEEVQGVWIYKGKAYEDRNQVLSVVTLDTKENRAWLKDFKEVLKKRFQQIEIFIKVLPVDLI